MSIPEWKTEELKHLESMWERRRHTGLPHSKTMWNTIALDWEKDLKENSERALRSRNRVEKTAEYLIRCGALNPETEVLDIGCGPGRFVAEFAKTAKTSSGLDLSNQMAEYGLRYCREQGLDNVSFIAADFKALDPQTEGLNGRYDLVFSSITPAVGSREGFLKALAMSKRWFFNAAFIDVRDSLLDRLDSRLGTNSSDPKNSEGFYAMFNEMLLRNFYPSIEYYTEKDTECYDSGQAFLRYSRALQNGEADEYLLSRLKETLDSMKDEDGLIRTEKTWVYGWMLIDKAKADFDPAILLQQNVH